MTWPDIVMSVSQYTDTRSNRFQECTRFYLQSHFCKRLTQSDNSFELSDCDRYWGSLSCFMCTSLHILFLTKIYIFFNLEINFVLYCQMFLKLHETNYLSDRDIILLQLHSCGFCQAGDDILIDSIVYTYSDKITTF